LPSIDCVLPVWDGWFSLKGRPGSWGVEYKCNLAPNLEARLWTDWLTDWDILEYLTEVRRVCRDESMKEE